ncbi:MAG: cardiolipin synthase ClsB [Desulfuromonadaceae bacterium]|nr:cardiolipin synthase ClsB [Desulfuromonadaceae bacterium]
MPQRKQRHRKLQQAFFPAGSSNVVEGNQISLLRNGEEYFPALETAFDRAQHEIYLEIYFYKNDATGRRIAKALKRAAVRGVNVFLLIDGYGSRALPQSMLDYLQTDGVTVLTFRPKISPWTFQRIRLRRMHWKVAVVDREIAFVGGINIIDDRKATDTLPPRYDYALAVEGPLVEVIRLAARRLWSRVAWNHFRKGVPRSAPPPVPTFTGGQMSAAFLVRDNFRHRRDIEKAYLHAIEQAQSEIILAHAYFLPGLDFRHALIEAAARGVNVILLLQGKVDHLLQYYAVRALYGNFLAGGVDIYEYNTGFLHAKVGVIDGVWATVGSSNLDPYSLLLSKEANVVVVDAGFGATLTQSLKQTITTDCQQIVKNRWSQQPVYYRFVCWLCYGFLRFMLSISGYAPESSYPIKKKKRASKK